MRSPGRVGEIGVPPVAPADRQCPVRGKRPPFPHASSCAGQRMMERPADHPPIPASRIGVLIVNLGSPDAPTPEAVKIYLKEFLSDPRVVEIPPLLWQPVLRGFVLTTRPRKSAHMPISRFGQPEGAPLTVITRKQAEAMQQRLGPAVTGRLGYALWQSVNRVATCRTQGGRLRPDPDRAALPAIFRGDDRNGDGHGGRHACRDALAACDSHSPAPIMTIQPISTR